MCLSILLHVSYGGQRGHQIPWNWRWLRATIWALRLESESSGRAANALTDETSLLPTFLSVV